MNRMVGGRNITGIILAPVIAFYSFWFITRGMVLVAGTPHRPEGIYTPALFLHWASYFLLGIFCGLPALLLRHEKQSGLRPDRCMMGMSIGLLVMFLMAYVVRHTMQLGFSFSVSLLLISGMAGMTSWSFPMAYRRKTCMMYAGITAFLLLFEIIMQKVARILPSGPESVRILALLENLPLLAFALFGIVTAGMSGGPRIRMRKGACVVFAAATGCLDLLLVYLFAKSCGLLFRGVFFANLNIFFATFYSARIIVWFFAGCYTTWLCKMAFDG